MKVLGLSRPLTFVLWRVDDANDGVQVISGVDALASTFGQAPVTLRDRTCVAVSDDGEHGYEATTIEWYEAHSTNSDQDGGRFRLRIPVDAVVDDLVAILVQERPLDVSVIVASPGSTWESQFVRLIGRPPSKGAQRVFPASGVPEAAYVAVHEMLNVVGWSIAPSTSRE